jgi:hypothetical protein
MECKIENNMVICPQTKESISIEELNKGLSKFYGQNISITEDNIKEFEGDILALCFGFN